MSSATPSRSVLNFKDFDQNMLVSENPERKAIPVKEDKKEDKKSKKGTSEKPTYYFQIPVRYNIESEETPVLTSFRLEGCELVSNGGILTKMTQWGKEEVSIKISFDRTNADSMRMVEIYEQIYARCVSFIDKNKKDIGMREFYADRPGASFKRPIYYPRDPQDEIDTSKNPSIFIKIFKFVQDGTTQKALFVKPNGDPLPWSVLSNVKMTFIPVIAFRHIYVGGGKASIQSQIVSAVVTSIEPVSQMSQQSATLARLREERPNLEAEVEKQLAKMNLESKVRAPDSPLGGDLSEGDSEDDEEAPTPTLEKISNFVGGAPSRHIQFN